MVISVVEVLEVHTFLQSRLFSVANFHYPSFLTSIPSDVSSATVEWPIHKMNPVNCPSQDLFFFFKTPSEIQGEIFSLSSPRELHSAHDQHMYQRYEASLASCRKNSFHTSPLMTLYVEWVHSWLLKQMGCQQMMHSITAVCLQCCPC